MEFIEMPIFTKLATRFLGMEKLVKIEEELIINPHKGDLIQGTHGARKVRAGGEGKGKRGGFRIIYYFHDTRNRIWLLNLYSKKSKGDLSPEEKSDLGRVVLEIKEIEDA